MACKPDFVQGLPPWTAIHLGLLLPTGSCNQPGSAGAKAAPDANAHAIPIWSCSRWGLPCQPCCQRRGGLLPHLFTLACARTGGLFSVALSLWLPKPGVTRHRCYLESGLSSLRGGILTSKTSLQVRPSSHPQDVCSSVSIGGGSRATRIFSGQFCNAAYVLCRQRTNGMRMKAQAKGVEHIFPCQVILAAIAKFLCG